MKKWIKKNNYEVCILAGDSDLGVKKSQVQLFKIHAGGHEHFHKKRTEFFYFTSGRGKAIIDGKIISIVPGTQFIIKPKTLHAFSCSKKTSLEGIMLKLNNWPNDTFTK